MDSKFIGEFFQKPAVHGLSWLYDEVLAQHEDNPQRRAQARQALDAVKEGLDGLAALGHQYEVARTDSASAAFQEYPKMLHNHSTGGHQIVFSAEEETKAKANGWHERPVNAPPKVHRPLGEGQESLQDKIKANAEEEQGNAQ